MKAPPFNPLNKLVMTNASPTELMATRDSKRLRQQISKPVYTHKLKQFRPRKKRKLVHKKIEKRCKEILRSLANFKNVYIFQKSLLQLT